MNSGQNLNFNELLPDIMAKIEFPGPLKELLEGSNLQAPIQNLADRVGEILNDNKLPFFPDYTDHGIDHINCVLKTEVELVPKQIWEKSRKDSDPRLLCDADAAVIIGATLLHDIAMHLQPGGFRELVSKNSRFKPLPWFKESRNGHSADASWHELWLNYASEARRFSDRQLTNLVGEESAKIWKFHALPDDNGQWERNHCLIIGEFIRRHHARLAHEIAIYGFPGLPSGSGESQFPAVGKETGHTLVRLADLIGLTARSHGISLRVCNAYLEASPLYLGTPRPMGTAVLYPMALLRVADYLQIDGTRAPAVLLQLHNPQSPISVQEWKKHRAVQQIGPANDPHGKMVTVNTDLSLSLYLQLRDLLSGLLAEMDHSTAVLDEAYGMFTELGLHQLNLATRRVYSNLQSPAFRNSLPYIPERTGFTADPNLLTLLVEPLYGNIPSVGVRELVQNAVDAVCELEVWCKVHCVTIESLNLPEQDGDVLVEFIKRENGIWILRVSDRGIGMTSDTIQNYFLRAGASFRRSAEWANNFLDENGQPCVIRAGRFGIGAFAVFLLGQSFQMWTRHADSDETMGYTIEASATSQLIQISRVEGLRVGTTIEVEMNSKSVNNLCIEKKNYLKLRSREIDIDWFCWDWPKVTKRIIRGSEIIKLAPKYICPIRKKKLPPDWFVIHPDGFDAVFWTFSDAPVVSCNGINITDPMGEEAYFIWPQNVQLCQPNIAVLDSTANLPLTMQRYDLSQYTVPFIDELTRDVTLSFIAYTLVCGPMSQAEALSLCNNHPLTLLGETIRCDDKNSLNSLFDGGFLQWCTTSNEIVPVDPWLYTLLNSKSCLVYGLVYFGSFFPSKYIHLFDEMNLLKLVDRSTYAVLPWISSVHVSPPHMFKGVNKQPVNYILDSMAREGMKVLGPMAASHIIMSIPSVSKQEEKIAPALWKKIPSPNPGCTFFETQTCTLDPAIGLEPFLETMKSVDNEFDGFYFVAEIQTKQVKTPKTMIAKIWLECLGRKAIPFDPEARKAMIDNASKHPELKRHIEAWQEMKHTGSKWVTGI